MGITNIGPCGCCGQVGPCPCSDSNCLYIWEFVADPINANMWVIIDMCGGGDGSTEPCCGCDEPSSPGEYLGEMRQTPCVPIAVGNTRCNCFHCTITWDAFLDQWNPGYCLGPNYESNAIGCNCPTSGFEPGTFHGQTLENVICGCPS